MIMAMKIKEIGSNKYKIDIYSDDNFLFEINHIFDNIEDVYEYINKNEEILKENIEKNSYYKFEVLSSIDNTINLGEEFILKINYIDKKNNEIEKDFNRKFYIIVSDNIIPDKYTLEEIKFNEGKCESNIKFKRIGSYKIQCSNILDENYKPLIENEEFKLLLDDLNDIIINVKEQDGE